MTVEEIIKQAEKLSDEEKQEIAYYFLFTTLSDRKKELFFKKLQNTKKSFDSDKTNWSFLGEITFDDNLDNINIRDYAHED